MKNLIFKTPSLIVIPFLALSLTACIFDSSKTDDKSDKAPENTILAIESDYIPKDGDQITFSFSYTIAEGDRVVGSGEYDQKTIVNIVNELPQQYGYQHPEAGPYYKVSSYKKRPSMVDEATGLEYYSTPSSDVLIDHNLNDHYYSTIEFADSTKTLTGSIDGLMVEGEVVIETKNRKLFDEVTGNEIGYETVKVTVTALYSEEITIQAGTFIAAKAKYHGEQITVINAHPKHSSTQSLSGYYWFDSKTAATLKYSAEGAYTAHNDLDRVFKKTVSSELVSSSEYENTMIAQNSHNQVSSQDLLKVRNITAETVMKNSHLLTQELRRKISAKDVFKF